MLKIGRAVPCSICQSPIDSGRPVLVFAVDKPQLAAVCHSTCRYNWPPWFSYAQYKMCPPYYLPNGETSFLAHAYYKLYGLPGGFEPNRELRLCLAVFLRDYPFSLANPMLSFRRFLNEHERKGRKWLYEGDLEADFFRTLGEIQRRAGDQPIGVEIYWSA